MNLAFETFYHDNVEIVYSDAGITLVTDEHGANLSPSDAVLIAERLKIAARMWQTEFDRMYG